MVVGKLIGLALALPLTRLLQNLLFEVKPNDPTTLASVALAVILTSLLASYFRARRATRVDSMVALRYE